MNVVVPCEYGKGLIENSGDNAWTTFSLYKVYGDFFKCSRADNSAARGRIWLNFGLVRVLMYVVIPCKYGKDPIENSEDNAWTTFSPYKVYGDFFKRSRAENSAVHGRIWLNFELNRDFVYFVVPCKYGKDPIENSGDNAWTPFSPYKVYGDFFKRSRADNSAARGRIWLNSSELLCKLLFLASMERSN